MLESRPEDALGSLVETVETVDIVETVETRARTEPQKPLFRGVPGVCLRSEYATTTNFHVGKKKFTRRPIVWHTMLNLSLRLLSWANSSERL